MRTEAETKQKATDTASSHCGSRAGVRSEAEYAGVADAGRTRAAEGTTRRQFLAPFGDWEVPKGFAKNGDAIEKKDIRSNPS
ncbi:uncharacterized protein sS8_0227 [Methylocaldum marinum]|uniref:Uncharacterized protein n=1 Tax=Methylocaldum marinum TaxID=1432792 RepID=A0A286P3H3_9GAMM|nr:uncharacterized protein sS8_0227 [Methylocaldum marinum]